MPADVPAAVTEASLMTDQHLAGTKPVAIRASRRRVGDPLAGRRLYKLAQHAYKPRVGPPPWGPPHRTRAPGIV